MKSVTLSTGDVYFENIAKNIIRISRIMPDYKINKWFFVVDTGTVYRECFNFDSEEQAEKDRKGLLLFVSKCEIKKETTNE